MHIDRRKGLCRARHIRSRRVDGLARWTNIPKAAKSEISIRGRAFILQSPKDKLDRLHHQRCEWANFARDEEKSRKNVGGYCLLMQGRPTVPMEVGASEAVHSMAGAME